MFQYFVPTIIFKITMKMVIIYLKKKLTLTDLGDISFWRENYRLFWRKKHTPKENTLWQENNNLGDNTFRKEENKLRDSMIEI